MSGEDNKRVVRSFFKAVEAGDLNQVDHLVTDDFTWWVTPTTIGSGTYAKKEWFLLMSGMLNDLAEPMTLQLIDLTAEDDRVSVTIVGYAPQKSGKFYNCHYHDLFWLRDGKISAVKEYLDTYHAGEIFGFPGATA
jgi:ketosteroid isomerase-like protein